MKRLACAPTEPSEVSDGLGSHHCVLRTLLLGCAVSYRMAVEPLALETQIRDHSAKASTMLKHVVLSQYRDWFGLQGVFFTEEEARGEQVRIKMLDDSPSIYFTITLGDQWKKHSHYSSQSLLSTRAFYRAHAPQIVSKLHELCAVKKGTLCSPTLDAMSWVWPHPLSYSLELMDDRLRIIAGGSKTKFPSIKTSRLHAESHLYVSWNKSSWQAMKQPSLMGTFTKRGFSNGGITPLLVVAPPEELQVELISYNEAEIRLCSSVVEQCVDNALVGGSIPSAGTKQIP